MLTDLRVKNFVIIDDLSINFEKGLNVLTGETGAGKSILIDALSCVLGEKITVDYIRSGFDKALVEGGFDITGLDRLRELLDENGIDHEDDRIVLRRELFSNGKGRCFVNSVQLPRQKLGEIASYLVDIHGQNEHHEISKISRHRELLDGYAGNEAAVREIGGLHAELSSIRQMIDASGIDEKEKARRIEYNNFVIREIESAALRPGEEEDLKNESRLLANAEKLFREINSAAEQFSAEGGILPGIKRAEGALAAVSAYDPAVLETLENMREAMYRLEDVYSFLRDYGGGIDYSPERINEVESRISLIGMLKKKYGGSAEEIIEYMKKAREENETINSSDERRDSLKQEYERSLVKAKKSALELSVKRSRAALELEKRVMKELAELGMPGAEFRVSINRELSPEGEIEADNRRYMLYPHGLDRVEFMLSANRGEELRPLRKAASGGEMSRIMLAIKNVILSGDVVDSLIFDEVDAGISGRIAEIVGKKLKSLAEERQVLIITHLPQIASMSHSHYYIIKDDSRGRASTVVKKLNEKEKIREVARLLAGEEITELSLKHAEEMVAMAGGKK